MKKIAYTLHFGSEYHGVFSSRHDARDAYEQAAMRVEESRGFSHPYGYTLLGTPAIRGIGVTRHELEGLKDDDVTDEEWAEYDEFPETDSIPSQYPSQRAYDR